MTDYTTVAAVKAQCGITTATHDTVLGALITAASATIDRFCNRIADGFTAEVAATTREFAGRGQSYLVIDECAVAPTLVEVKSAVTGSYVSWAATDWQIAAGSPWMPVFGQTPYDLLLANPSGDYSTFLDGFLKRNWPSPTVRVTAQWGFATTTPTDIAQACVIQATRWFKRGESSWTDTTASTDLGTLLYTGEIDPDVKLILVRGKYMRVAV
jgi:hypothetical protein